MSTPDGMTRSSLVFLVAASVAVAATCLSARPRYGGTLRVATLAPVRTLDPAAVATSDAFLARRIQPLVFETMLAIDPQGGVRPLLAVSARREPGAPRWRIRPRPNVKWHDGSTATVAQFVTILGGIHPDWRITADGDDILIEPGGERPDVLWQLAQPQSAMARRLAAGGLAGTGPFRIDRLDAARL